jgi:hypothetical protein
VLTYDDQGNVKAVIVFGCAVLTAKKKTQGEIETEQGSAGKTDRGAGGVLRVCFPTTATPPTNTPSGGAGGLFGLGRAATIAIFTAGGAAALTPLFFQSNPSGSTP